MCGHRNRSVIFLFSKDLGGPCTLSEAVVLCIKKKTKLTIYFNLVTSNDNYLIWLAHNFPPCILSNIHGSSARFGLISSAHIWGITVITNVTQHRSQVNGCVATKLVHFFFIFCARSARLMATYDPWRSRLMLSQQLITRYNSRWRNEMECSQI